MSDDHKPMGDGGPAFPHSIALIHERATTSCDFGLPGASLRDYFAAKAMQGIVGSISSEEGYLRLVDIAHQNDCARVSEWIAKDAYKQADAMLKARERS